MRQVKKILVMRNDRFGEFLLNIPAFGALKKGYPGARLCAAVDPYVRELASRIEWVDEVITFENRKHTLGEILAFSKELRGRRFDLCVVFNPSRDLHLAAFLAGIPVRVGYRRKLGSLLLTKTMPDGKGLGLKHEVEYNLELVAMLGVKTEDKTLSLNIERDASDIERKFSLDNARNLVAIHPWTSDPLKQWPARRFFQLAKRFGEYPSIQVVMIGRSQESERSEELFLGLGEKAVDLCGKTSLIELAALLKRSKLLISADSGPVHLAASVGTRTIALFRSDLPGKTARRWGPWGEGHTVIARDNLMDITVEEVFNKAKEALGL